MSCPHLKEVVMLFCDAYPVKKMLPLDRLATAHPCLGHDFAKCPLFLELAARLAAAERDDREAAAADHEEARHVARTRSYTADGGHAGPSRR